MPLSEKRKLLRICIPRSWHIIFHRYCAYNITVTHTQKELRGKPGIKNSTQLNQKRKRNGTKGQTGRPNEVEGKRCLPSLKINLI